MWKNTLIKPSGEGEIPFLPVPEFQRGEADSLRNRRFWGS